MTTSTQPQQLELFNADEYSYANNPSYRRDEIVVRKVLGGSMEEIERRAFTQASFEAVLTQFANVKWRDPVLTSDGLMWGIAPGGDTYELQVTYVQMPQGTTQA